MKIQIKLWRCNCGCETIGVSRVVIDGQTVPIDQVEISGIDEVYLLPDSDTESAPAHFNAKPGWKYEPPKR